MNVNGLKQTLGKKAGPLPIGAWVLIGLVGFMVAKYLRSRNAAASQDVNANLADQTPSDAASLGALDPGYGYDGGSGNGDAGTGGDSGGGVGGSIAPSGNVDAGTGGDGGNVGPTAPAASTTPDATAPASPDAPADSGHPQAASAAVVDKAVGVVVRGLKFGTKKAQKDGASSTTAGRDSTRTTTGHAPELVSEHGRGGGFQPHAAPAGKSTSKAVTARKVESARDGGPSSPAHSIPAMMAVAAPSGHSPALAPSAAPSTVGVATTTAQHRASGHKMETDG